MNGPGDHFLSSPGLSYEKHSRTSTGNQFNLRHDLHDCITMADDVSVFVFQPELAAQVGMHHPGLVFQLLYLGECHALPDLIL